MKDLLEFNLNSEIGVQLADRAHRNAFDHQWSRLGLPPSSIPQYEKPIPDEDGFIWMQAWIFINHFGYLFHMGGPEGVKMTIRIKKKNLTALASSIKDAVP